MTEKVEERSKKVADFLTNKGYQDTNLLPIVKINDAETRRLRATNQVGSERFRDRLLGYGLYLAVVKGIPLDYSYPRVLKLASHPTTLRIASTSQTLAARGGFQKYFNTSIHRVSINYHRDSQTAARRQEALDNDPITLFFAKNPQGSEQAIRLLSTLNPAQRLVFVGRYFNTQSDEQLAQRLKTDPSLLPDYYTNIKSRLRETIAVPSETWDVDPIYIIIAAYPNLLDRTLSFLPADYQTFIRLRYEKNLGLEEIDKALNYNSLGATKSLSHRIKVKFEGILNRLKPKGDRFEIFRDVRSFSEDSAIPPEQVVFEMRVGIIPTRRKKIGNTIVITRQNYYDQKR